MNRPLEGSPDKKYCGKGKFALQYTFPLFRFQGNHLKDLNLPVIYAVGKAVHRQGNAEAVVASLTERIDNASKIALEHNKTRQHPLKVSCSPFMYFTSIRSPLKLHQLMIFMNAAGIYISAYA